MDHTLTIDGRKIGAGCAPYLVAEMSGNHKGDLKRAYAILEAAKEAGADAVKLQTYTASTITIKAQTDDFKVKGGLWDGRTLYELYQEAYTPWEWHEALIAKGGELGMTVFSTPFDQTALDFLEKLGCPAYKIASFEIVDLPLIEKAALTRKPLIISTGMASLAEVGEAVEVVHRTGGRSLALLHCTSGYPTPAAESNLRTIPHLAKTFGTIVGLSDHTPGIAVPVAAVALGASIIEKHLTLRRTDGGPDAAFSLEPEEFKDLVTSCQTAWTALGRVEDARTPSELPNALLRRSLYVVEDIAKGESFTPQNMRSIRPGFGLLPKHTAAVLGRRAARDIARGTPLDWSMVEPSEKEA